MQKEKMIKLIYKLLICPWKGHNYVKTQYPDWPDYYQLQCKNCRYLDKVKHPSLMKIMKNDYHYIIEVTGGGGGGSSSSETIIAKSAGYPAAIVIKSDNMDESK